jgi:hypothetical protein
VALMRAFSSRISVGLLSSIPYSASLTATNATR